MVKFASENNLSPQLPATWVCGRALRFSHGSPTSEVSSSVPESLAICFRALIDGDCSAATFFVGLGNTMCALVGKNTETR